MKVLEKEFNNVGKIAFFEEFVIHIQKHILDDLQPWDRVFSRKKLKLICQKISDEKVLDVYNEIITEISKAITFSVSFPIYIYKNIGKDKCYYFIAKKGFIVIVRNSIIRTVYFPVCNLNDSNYTLFKKAWRAVKRKTYRVNWKNKDDKRIVKMIKEEFWHKCPNPNKN